MGLIADTFERLVPSRKAAPQPVATSLPSWQSGQPLLGEYNYERFAREGYGANELVYACIEERSTSLAEPPFAVYRRAQGSEEMLDDHDVLRLLEEPNPYMDAPAFLEAIELYLCLAGNCYVEKVRSAAQKVVQLWLLRPDRVRVIPDEETYIRGYSYQLGDRQYFLRPDDVIHIKGRHALDAYYGMSPLAVLAGRIDTDNFMRSFTRSFFVNAGVPAGLLMLKSSLDEQDRASLQRRFREGTGGPAGWHSLLVLEEADGDYKTMGMPLGERGLVLPELNDINESRIGMVFGVPLSLIESRLGMASSSYANRKSDLEHFTDGTLMPEWRRIAAALTRGLRSDYGGFSRIGFDFRQIRLLQENDDAKHTRVRENVRAGIESIEEGRVELGLPPQPEGGEGTFLVPANILPTPASALFGGGAAGDEGGEPDQEAAEREYAMTGRNGHRAG